MTMLIPLAMALLQQKHGQDSQGGNTAIQTPHIGPPPKIGGGAPAQTMGAPLGAGSPPPGGGPRSPLDPSADGITRQDPYTLGAQPGAQAPPPQAPPVMAQTAPAGPPMQTWGNEGADRPDLDYYGGIYHRSPWEDGNG